MSCGDLASDAEGLPDLTGKVCVVTGATSGIGKMTALALGELGSNLVLVGRHKRGAETLLRRFSGRSSRSRCEFIRTDLSNQKEVHALADQIIRRYPQVDVLINNAGARNDDYAETADGLERTFATNHLGHFLLTCLLLERLVQAPAARVVTVSSGTHTGVNADGDWSMRRDGYDRRVAYAKSKLANIMFAYELAERLKSTHVTSNAVDPGGVATNFARNNGLLSWLRHLVGCALRHDLASPGKGAQTVIYVAASNQVKDLTGRLFRNCRESRASAIADDDQQRKKLWSLSLTLTGLQIANSDIHSLIA